MVGQRAVGKRVDDRDTSHQLGVVVVRWVAIYLCVVTVGLITGWIMGADFRRLGDLADVALRVYAGIGGAGGVIALYAALRRRPSQGAVDVGLGQALPALERRVGEITAVNAAQTDALATLLARLEAVGVGPVDQEPAPVPPPPPPPVSGPPAGVGVDTWTQHIVGGEPRP